MEGDIIISFSNDKIEKQRRDRKGKSIIAFPKEYIVIDIETTGLSPDFDSIIELSAIKVQDNKIIDSFSSLVKPEEQYIDDDADINDYPNDFVLNSEGDKVYYVDNFIKELTGISNRMLHDAPSIEDALPKYIDFVSNNMVIGHNVNFDINFIYDECIRVMEKTFENNFIDTMRIARRLLRNLGHHRLIDIAEYYKISTDGSHRALRDCEITNACLAKMKLEIIEKYSSVDEFVKIQNENSNFKGHYPGAKDIRAQKSEFDETNPLFGKKCVFTGVLEKMVRKNAMQLVADFGGINEDTVTKQTNFLVLGNNDYCSTIKDGKSTKQKKAEAYKLKGSDIEIISENVFYDMINNS